MPKNNAKIRWTIIGFFFSAFVILVGWGSSYVTAKISNTKVDAKAEQKVEDTMQSHTYWIEKLEENVETIMEDTSAIKETLGRYDERLIGLEKNWDKIDSKLDNILEKL